MKASSGKAKSQQEASAEEHSKSHVCNGSQRTPENSAETIRGDHGQFECNLSLSNSHLHLPGMWATSSPSFDDRTFAGKPIHQRGRAQPGQTTDHRVEEEPALVARGEDSRDSLRNLLQILLPPRAFGRRHEQKTPNAIS